jgi:hypothetical protein
MSTSTSSDKPHHGYVSSESESRQPSSSAGKKRASRAGTRSVTTLSAAQLERKRANDREAQRAIRQRTKDHIDNLERNINELKAAHDASEKMVAVTRQRNRELEDENVYLRSKLGEAGFPVSLPPTDSKFCGLAEVKKYRLTKVCRPKPRRADYSLCSCHIPYSTCRIEHSAPRLDVYGPE